MWFLLLVAVTAACFVRVETFQNFFAHQTGNYILLTFAAQPKHVTATDISEILTRSSYTHGEVTSQ